MIDYTSLINREYPAGSRRRDIYMRHCGQVAALALQINAAMPESLDPTLVEAAAMLHDIGIVRTDAAGLDCHGTLPYIAHGPAGADIIREAGLGEDLARVAERHTGSGLTAEEIEEGSLPLPAGRVYLPQTPLERLICYADKFYSKSGDMTRHPLPKVMSMMRRHSEGAYERFMALHNEFAPYFPAGD